MSAETVPFPKGPPHNILALPDSCSQFRYYLQGISFLNLVIVFSNLVSFSRFPRLKKETRLEKDSKVRNKIISYLQTLGPNVGVMYRHGHVCSIFAELAAGTPR